MTCRAFKRKHCELKHTHSGTLLRNLMSVVQRSQHPVRGKVTSPGNRMQRAPAAILIRAKPFPGLCFLSFHSQACGRYKQVKWTHLTPHCFDSHANKSIWPYRTTPEHIFHFNLQVKGEEDSLLLNTISIILIILSLNTSMLFTCAISVCIILILNPYAL